MMKIGMIGWGRPRLAGLLSAAVLMLSATLSAGAQDYKYNFQTLEKKADEILFFERLSDVAYVDKVRLAGPPKAVQNKQACEFLDTLKNNPIKFYSYVFFPKEVKQGRKYPLIVFSHGGIHGTMSTVYVHVLRELMAQGYIVICPDYRGSTGYGKGFYQAIDYGGVENEDVLAARDYMVENYSVVDGDRVGLLGWSHGGMISLMNILKYPDKYACAYAGVPVSEVAYRLEYQKPTYKDEFSAKYHVGKLPADDPAEYVRRSPSGHAKLLRKPLMITTTVNDDDVSWTEVQRMADSLSFYGKEFTYKVYPPTQGAHVFERIDVKEASLVRFETYRFLAKYLKPRHPFKTHEELRKAGYKYY